LSRHWKTWSNAAGRLATRRQAQLRLLEALYQGFSQGDHPLRADFASFREAGGEALEHHCRFEVLQARRWTRPGRRLAQLAQGLARPLSPGSGSLRRAYPARSSSTPFASG
jgi:4-alpha-glucanotransferase